MTTNRVAQPSRHPFTPFREDTTAMFHIEYRYKEIKERQSRYQAEARRERQAKAPHRTFRHRMGESIIRVGQKVGGETVSDALCDPMPSPAWQG
jgi:hypothetical protein